MAEFRRRTASWLQRIAADGGVLVELLAYLWRNRLWWLIPMVAILVMLGLLLLFATTSGVGPFIYTLF